MNGISVNSLPGSLHQKQVVWTPLFGVFVAYACLMVTARLHVATEMMAVAIVVLFLRREAWCAPTFFWLFVAWIVWAAVGYVVTRYPDAVWLALVEHGKLVLVTLVAVNALRTRTQIWYFMLFLLVSYLLFPARSSLVGYVRGNTLFGRAIGPIPYENPNDLAALTILMLGPALALWSGAPRGSLVRWGGLAGAAPLIVIIVLTQSRGAFIALAAITLPSVFALVRRRPRTVVALAALIGVALYLAPGAFWQRVAGLGKATSVSTIAEMDPEGSARLRWAVLQNALHMVQDHPLVGVGLGAYGPANRAYNAALGDLDTHNTYMNILAETGVPGLALFLALVAVVLRDARRVRRRAGQVLPVQADVLRWLQYTMVGYLVAGLFGSYSRLTFPYLFLSLLWCASRAVRAQCPPDTRPPQPSPPIARLPWFDRGAEPR